MRAYEAHSVVPPAARTVPDASHDAMYAAQHVAEYAAQHGAKMMPALYNPSGGRRVQLAWQRFSTSPPGSSNGGYLQRRPAARPCGRPARLSARVYPAAFR